MSKETEEFLYNVLLLRKKYGLSKKEMANLLGIGIGSLNKIENGILPPRLKTDVIFKIQNNFMIHPKDQWSKQ